MRTTTMSGFFKDMDNKDLPRPIFILRAHEGVVTALHFTNEVDDAIREKPALISGSDSGEIFIWNLKTQRTCHRLKAHNGKMILYLCYHKSALISQGRDGNIHVWKFIRNEWSIYREFSSSSYGFCAASLLVTEAETLLVTPTGDQSSITFYDYDTSTILNSYEHKEIKKELPSSQEMCMCMKVIIKEGKLFLLMGYDSGFLSLWDYESNKEKSRLQCHPEVLLCLDYDVKYRNRGISGSVNENLQAWKIDKDDELIQVGQVATSATGFGINALKIRGDGKVLITAGQDKSVRVFSWKSLTPLAVLLWHRKPVFSLDFSTEPFGKYNSLFASGSKDNNIYVSSVY